MLSEEEKEAIEYFSVVNFLYNQGLKDMKYLDDMANRMNILLNLIEKLQKEIKHQKQQRKYWRDNFYEQQEEIEVLKEDLDKKVKALDIAMSNPDYICKDKIREKIKNIEDIYKKEMKPYQTKYGLNVSLLSKKEKEELINKRNGLLTQKITLEDLLEGK